MFTLPHTVLNANINVYNILCVCMRVYFLLEERRIQEEEEEREREERERERES